MTTKTAEYSPFPEANFYAALCEQANNLQLQMYVFFPESISLNKQQIVGYQYVNGKWVQERFPFPKLLYDRVFYNAAYYQKHKRLIQRFKEHFGIICMNRGLPSKWDLYQQLWQEVQLRAHLPKQELYRDSKQLMTILGRERSIILKPIAGGFGKKVMHLISGEPAILEGRSPKNKFFRRSFPSTTDAIHYLEPKLNRRYLVQSYLELTTPAGHPYDIRLFVQKNEAGEWTVIGKGVRLGPKMQLTSNIRGGGEARSFEAFIQSIHPAMYTQIEATINKIGRLVPITLEQRYAPLFELGIDIGVDRYGKVWIIEANAKPGRKIFELMGDYAASQQAIIGPINYARYLLEREQGGSK